MSAHARPRGTRCSDRERDRGARTSLRPRVRQTRLRWSSCLTCPVARRLRVEKEYTDGSGGGRPCLPAGRPGASSESVDEGDDLFGQAAALVEHLGVGGGDRAQDELAGAGGAVSLEQIDDRLGVADGHVGARLDGAAGAGGESLDAALDDRLLPAAEAEADAGAVVVVLDDAAEGAGPLFDRGDDAADL